MTPLDTLFEQDFERIIKQSRVYPLPKKLAIPKLIESDFSSISPFRNGDSSFSTSNDFKNYNTVARIFYPRILVGKYLGICPVEIIQSSEEDKGLRYNFKYISLSFILSIFLAFLNLFVLIIWIFNALLDSPGPFGITM